MIRIIIAVFCLVLFMIVSLILLPVEWVIGKISQEAKDKSSMAIIKFMFHLIIFCAGTKVTAIGVENIPKDEPVLFIGNHHSAFDVLISYCYVNTVTGYIAKKELNSFLFVRRWMRNIRCIFMDRHDVKQSLRCILQGIDYIKNGISVFVFPEGTRNKEPDGLLPFHAGTFKLAEKTHCKVIAVSQNNTQKIFEDHLPKLYKTHTVIEFSKPVDTKDFTREEFKALPSQMENLILDTTNKNKSLL